MEYSSFRDQAFLAFYEIFLSTRNDFSERRFNGADARFRTTGRIATPSVVFPFYSYSTFGLVNRVNRALRTPVVKRQTGFEEPFDQLLSRAGFGRVGEFPRG